MLLQAGDAGVDETEPSGGATTLLAPPLQASAEQTLAADMATATDEDGSFLQGLAVAVLIAVPFWTLLTLGIYLIL